ncbi:MAG: hypothetical protein WKF47_11485 [Geodermatophilaceae bacterium]
MVEGSAAPGVHPVTRGRTAVDRPRQGRLSTLGLLWPVVAETNNPQISAAQRRAVSELVAIAPVLDDLAAALQRVRGAPGRRFGTRRSTRPAARCRDRLRSGWPDPARRAAQRRTRTPRWTWT